VPIFREGEAPPSWCELEAFELVALTEGESAERARTARKERLLGCLGTVQVVHPGGSMVLKEGQFLDIDLLPAPRYTLKGLSPEAQVVRLSGHWGSEVAGCGIFRVENIDKPADRGDPVDYPKRTRIDSHYHDCDEYWILLEGRARVVVGGHHMEMAAGDCVSIGMGHHHDMPEAHEAVKAVFFETTLEGRKRVGHLWNHTHGPAAPHPERV